MKKGLYIGTSGWHYTHWLGLFYPKEVTGYNELRFHSQHFNTVENNSSFYRTAGESTYKTWDRMTPEHYRFSMKLNKLITHIHRLELNDEVRERVHYVMTSTEVLGEKLGAIVIQLPASFKLDIKKLDAFLAFFMKEVGGRKTPLDVAVEFRNKYWFVEEVYKVLRKHNVALVAAQSSRYPGAREVTADFAYIRLHGPEKLFASGYAPEQLKEWAAYIRSVMRKKAAKEKARPAVDRVYVYFNNDFHGYALENAKAPAAMLMP